MAKLQLDAIILGTDSSEAPAEEPARRVDAFGQAFIPRSNAACAMETLNRLMRHSNSDKAVANPAQCFLLTGPSGSGKTTLLRDWASRFVDGHSGLKDQHPILYVLVPPNCTPRGLAEQILRALGMPRELDKKRWPDALLPRHVAHHLRERQVKVVVLDEAQHLINSDDDRATRKVADTLAHLLNAGPSSFVLSGTPDVSIVLEANEQLMCWSAGRVHLYAADWKERQDRDSS